MLRFTLRTLALVALVTIAVSCSDDDDPTPRFTVDFEDLELDANSYWDGADKSGKFVADDVTFPNDYNDQYKSWQGFAYSNMTDMETPGRPNQYSVYGKSGAMGSKNFGLGYIAMDTKFNIMAFPRAVNNVRLYVTNGTYAYLAMKNGDNFTKKFGGEDGNDPDFCKLICIGLDEDGEETGKVEIFLADYRFDNNAEDYILTEWKEFDLTQLGKVKSVRFEMDSSDKNEWGMKNPAYYFVDNISYE
ncbi:hypothetical protein FUAX_48860 (plasmid) [Fulvitalea axinellae]|uniref:DUF4465 domain-containing protein n=1 Tax=Fulvitalea axinellae TaxID=1182444 RepID=A0AAU9DDA6_9BACT|nr:hypothetical protein FUAX_48860 [Fulvitalea axinellae]